jgi:hypothetical protein
MDDNILKPIDVMEINELIAVLTIRKDEFNEDYREKVLVELNNRVLNSRCFESCRI